LVFVVLKLKASLRTMPKTARSQGSGNQLSAISLAGPRASPAIQAES